MQILEVDEVSTKHELTTLEVFEVSGNFLKVSFTIT